MRFSSREIKRLIPGMATGVLFIIVTATLLFLSMDKDSPPHANLYCSSNAVDVGDPLFFDGRNSTDPEGRSLSYHWTINDTIYTELPAFHYSFPHPGNFTVILKVTDTKGNSDTETMIIDVRGK
ncbi:MAG: PKD domain-containing protein [Thermoplasmatota archaeon]